jgi:hypothetical protein
MPKLGRTRSLKISEELFFFRQVRRAENKGHAQNALCRIAVYPSSKALAHQRRHSGLTDWLKGVAADGRVDVGLLGKALPRHIEQRQQ